MRSTMLSILIFINIINICNVFFRVNNDIGIFVALRYITFIFINTLFQRVKCFFQLIQVYSILALALFY